MDEQGEKGTTDRRKEGGAVQIRQTLAIAKRIGKGRLGSVYGAVHEVLARRFAVKVLRQRLTSADGMPERLRHMTREVSQVEHPHIVSLHDVGQLPDGRFFLTMDFVRGIQLARLLEREGRVSVVRATQILIQVAEALEAAHQRRVVHGDLKPTNIMLMEMGGGRDFVRILDWQLCPSLMSAEAESIGPVAPLLQIFGTVDYLAPEQLTGGPDFKLERHVDSYAVGVLAYHLLTGQPPFVGVAEQVMEAHCTRDPVPPSRRSGGEVVPAELDAIVLRCLEKNPTDRFRSMDELARELRELSHRHPLGGLDQSRDPWVAAEDEDADGAEEADNALPESPARVRRLLYDAVVELTQHMVEENVASEQMVDQLGSLLVWREEATRLAAEGGLMENRFEDIRRELREGESTRRYEVIDLNLAKSELIEQDGSDEQVKAIEDKIAGLERELAELERQRVERFDALNAQVEQNRNKQKTLEHQMALGYRRLYTELDRLRGSVRTAAARRTYRRLERCRTALSRIKPARQ